MDVAEQKIFTRIRAVLAKMLKLSDDKIELESTIRDDLGIDSVEGLDMFFSLEDEFKIKLAERELVSLLSVGDIVRLVQRKTAGG